MHFRKQYKNKMQHVTKNNRASKARCIVFDVKTLIHNFSFLLSGLVML